MPETTTNPELLLRRLEWRVMRRLDGLLHGDYRTLFRGFGLDLAGLREYQSGDDVRHIDWNVTARLQTPHVREYNEDRDVNAWFLLDLSPSVDFGSETATKREVAAAFTTVLTQLLSRHGNRVGALLYGDQVDTFIPARNGRRHVLHLLNRMLQRPTQTESAPTDLQAFLRHAGQFIRRRSVVFVVSDFFSETAWSEALARLALRHEVIAVRLFDPMESVMPDLGMLLMRDAESGEQLMVDTSNVAFRKRFADAAARREHAVRSGFAEAGVDALELSTTDDIASSVVRFADLRKRRGNLAAGGGMPRHMGGAR